MRKYGHAIAGALCVALIFVFLVVPAEVRSQGLPEGVSVVIVSEHESSTPGVAKIKLIKMTFQPGAAFENISVPYTSL